MAEEQDQLDDNIDDVANKAAEIGKIIGVEDAKGAKDDAPDYDIAEGDDDSRIAKEREPRAERTERKQLTTKEKRDLRKKRIDEKFDQKNTENAQLRAQLEATAARLNEFENRFAGIDRAEIDKALNQTSAALAQAEKDYQAAFNEGDGIKSSSALSTMYDAKQRLAQLQGLKQQHEKVPQRPAAGNTPDPRTISKAKAWAAKQDWYNPNGTHEDSEIAKSLSQVLANEGFDPAADDFWDELDDRLAARGIGNSDDEDEPAPAVDPKPRKRTAPPVGGGSQRGDVSGKIKITLPTKYINMLKDNGIWDDLPRRNRVIAGYLKTRREIDEQRN